MSSVCCAAFPPPRPSSHPVDVGHRSEAAIIRELELRGYSVSVPLGTNQRYDLIVDVGRLLRIQCKTGRIRNGAVVFRTESIRSNTRRAYRRGYVGEVDWFAVYCPDNNGVYFVPIEGIPLGEGRLRVEPTINNQAAGVRWARDYELPAPSTDLDFADRPE